MYLRFREFYWHFKRNTKVTMWITLRKRIRSGKTKEVGSKFNKSLGSNEATTKQMIYHSKIN